MSNARESDVSRVLGKMGRKDFSYRDFGNGPTLRPLAVPNCPKPIAQAANEQMRPQDVVQQDHTRSEGDTVAAAYSLLSDALPETADMPLPSAPPLPPERPNKLFRRDDDSTPAIPQPVMPKAQEPIPQSLRLATGQASNASPGSTPTPPLLFSRRNMPDGNPFPPRATPQSPSHGGTTPMATVFRRLAGQQRGGLTPEAPAESDIGSRFGRN